VRADAVVEECRAAAAAAAVEGAAAAAATVIEGTETARGETGTAAEIGGRRRRRGPGPRRKQVKDDERKLESRSPWMS
jgi:hypothetical protein